MKKQTDSGLDNGAGPGGAVSEPDALFGRVASILEQARGNVVRAVNHNMVVAYWLIGREIVMELQRGQERAGYGERVIQDLSTRLISAFGKGYSVESLWKFRLFYLAYASVPGILSTSWTESDDVVLERCGESAKHLVPEFDQRLTWSHYRALMRVANRSARDHYEKEAASCAWTVLELERQIHTRSYERLLTTQTRSVARCETNAVATDAPIIPVHSPVPLNPLDALKDPYVLEFLDIPDPTALHESGLEGAIIAHLRDFLLELGKGFAFVARQKRLSFEDEHLYVDLVFYSIPLRCYLLIDLKTGKLTPSDVGQMDSYVRMFDDLMAGPEQNPTIGLILCTEHNSAVARYSILNDRHQVFASRYMTCLPTETELAAEIQRTRALLENRTTPEVSHGGNYPEFPDSSIVPKIG